MFPNLPEEYVPITIVRDKYIIPSKSSEEEQQPDSLHVEIFKKNFNLFENLAQCIYGPVKNIFSTYIDPSVRSICLSATIKIIYYINTEQLIPLLKVMLIKLDYKNTILILLLIILGYGNINICCKSFSF